MGSYYFRCVTCGLRGQLVLKGMEHHGEAYVCTSCGEPVELRLEAELVGD